MPRTRAPYAPEFRRQMVELVRAGLLGPRGVVIRSGNLFLVNQNVGLDVPGEILRLDAGGPPLKLKRVVPAGTPTNPNPDAPFAPRGMAFWNNHLFVANVCDPCAPGRGGGAILKYTAAGVKVGSLRSGKLTFYPFGAVIGPDGLLYVSSRPNLFTDGLGGQVLQFDPRTGNYIKTFISSGGGVNRLNGPEGLVFGPDGRLYITSFRGSDSDTDKILIFDGPGGAHPGRRVGKIELDRVGEPRAIALALLFGPGGDLFVPISNVIEGDGEDGGAIRRYRIGCAPTATRKCFSNFVRPCDELGASCKLGQGWYLTFGKTRPGTLAYGR